MKKISFSPLLAILPDVGLCLFAYGLLRYGREASESLRQGLSLCAQVPHPFPISLLCIFRNDGAHRRRRQMRTAAGKTGESSLSPARRLRPGICSAELLKADTTVEPNRLRPL